MIRRSRISVRPNVGRPGRAGATATAQEAPSTQDDPPVDPTPAEATAQTEDDNNMTAAEVEDNNNSTTAGLTTAIQREAADDHGEASTAPTTTTSITTPAPTTISSSANLQRRKRVSVKPKVSAAPNRASARASANQNIQTQASKPPAEEGLAGPPGSDLEEPITTAAAAAHHVDPIPKAHIEGAGPGNDPTTQETPVEPTPSEKAQNLESLPAGPAKEVPPKPPDEAPFSIPDKEARENSERARILLAKASKVGTTLPKNMRLSQLLHDQTDLQRMAKAQRLRELLRQEMGKEKEKQGNRKSRYRLKEYALDPSKMTMRDLVHYLPASNPMTAYLEESVPEDERVVPASPTREVSTEKVKDPEDSSLRAEVEEDEDDEVEDDEEEGGVMVPRVKVAEDGSLIIDEESLTIEVKRAKGPNPANDRDAVFERGSTTTYSSFRKKTHSKAWSSEETDMFFLAVSMVGTDFSMIGQLFPHRARSEIKNKFKREERANSWRVDKAFKERRKLDLKFFSKLLEKILELQSQKKRKPKVPSEKKTRKPTKKANGRTTAKDLSDVEEDPQGEEEEEEEEHDGQEDPDYVGERHNVGDVPETPVDPSSAEKPVESSPSDQKPKPKIKSRKRANKEVQAETSVPEEAEAAVPEDGSSIKEPEDAEQGTPPGDTTTQPGKRPRARAVKPVLPPRRKKGKEAVALPPDSPASNSQDAPASDSQEAPASDSQEAPASDSQDAPASDSQEAPVKNSQDAPASDSQEAPASDSQEAPASDSQDAPASDSQEAPVKNSQDAPASDSQEAPASDSQDAPASNSQDAPATLETLASDAEEVDEEPFTQAKKRKKLEYDDDDDNDNSSQDEVSPIKIDLKPTRYGRMPKATQHLNYPAAASPGRPPTSSTPRPRRPPHKTSSSKAPAQEPKQSKLVMLRASPSDCSDDEDEDDEEEKEDAGLKKPVWVGLEEEEEEEENRPRGSDPMGVSCAPVFVPASLRSPRPVVSAVEETMEELDILVNVPDDVPDVLDITQDSSHHAPFEHAQNEMDSVPFEHSLDLLADVIDFLSPDHAEVSDNEAAHTLLTIGNRSLQSLLAHIEDPSEADFTTDLPAVSDPGITNQKEDVEPDGDFLDILSATTAPSDAPTVDSAHQDISATHNDPEALTVDKPIPDTPNASGSSISDGPLAAVKAEPKPLQREAPVEAAVPVAAISSPPRKHGRLAKIKPKPNLLRASRVARPTPNATTESHEADGKQTPGAAHKEDVPEQATLPAAVELESSVPSTGLVPPSSAGGLRPPSRDEIPEETPAGQDGTAGRGRGLEVEPQLETSVKKDPQEEASARFTLETVPEAATGSEPRTDPAPSHPSCDVAASGMLPATAAKVAEVVQPRPMVARRRQFPKAKPNLGRGARTAPSVESDPTKVSPVGNASSSEPQPTEDKVTPPGPGSTHGATGDLKTHGPTSLSPVTLIKAGSAITPTGAGVGREEGKGDVVDSPGGSRAMVAQVQTTKDDHSDTSKQDNVPASLGPEPKPVADHGSRSEVGTRPRTARRVAAPTPLQASPKQASEPLEPETSGCMGARRSRAEGAQETSGPGATRTPAPAPQPAQREEEPSPPEGGPAVGDGAVRPPAGSKDSLSDGSSSQSEEGVVRTKPQCVPGTSRRRISHVKPKPNLGPQASRVSHVKQPPTRRQVPPSQPDTGPGTPREALPSDSQGGGDAVEEHRRPSRSSSVAAQLDPVVSSANETTLIPSVRSTPDFKNTSPANTEKSLLLPDPFDTTEDVKPPASIASSTWEASVEGTTSSHGASWLVENPFTVVDEGVDEVLPSVAQATAPPVGQENSRASRCDQASKAPAFEPLSRPVAETSTPAPQTGLPVLPVPSDPEEPFFILSLTEIPAPPNLPGAEAAPEPLSDPVTPATPAGRSSGRRSGLRLHQDAGSSLPTQTAHVTEQPDHQQDPDPVQAPELPEAEVRSVEAEPPSKRRRALSGSRQRKKPSPSAADAEPAEGPQDPPSKKRRGARRQGEQAPVEVQPRSTGTRQTRRAFAGKAPSADVPQSQGSTDTPPPPGSTGLLEAEQGGRTPDEPGDASRPIETQPPKAPALKRKPKGFLSFLAGPVTPGPSGTLGSKVRAPPLAPQVKASRGVARKPGPASEGGAKKTPLKVVSVAPQRRPAPVPVSCVSTGPAEPRPATSGRTAETAPPHQEDQLSVSRGDEEPTNVSQYFLSDIFTEVDE
ncbi:transcription factor TFIIIB component B'' homolog isoform X2 [Gadus macrocephalus]|uniref:transcription factor TFIIIB component B'' homolog isoform X2 n=1 Tax=Gadus macrocephalus TaxID=80720 RepID=UPI0028CBA10A|nr:transcription factor TFIIIB component B'' homolog isoform X2 [Gadus macrocephalus]